MKTLVTCTPTEFLQQTNKLRKLISKWLSDTGILEIRKHLPELKVAPDGATSKEKREVGEENKRRLAEQSKKNLEEIFDAVLEKYPEQTLEIMAVCCFVEPEDLNNHRMDEYLGAMAELISNQSVISFFSSLVQLGILNTATVSEA